LTIREVLGAVHATLAEAEQGLADLINWPNPARQWYGLKTTILAGRRVTFALQKLKSREPTFEAWYEPRQRDMGADPLMQYFNKVRTFLEHEATLPQPIYAIVELINGEELAGRALVGLGEDEFGLWIHGALDGAPRPIGDEEARAVRGASVQRLSDIRLPDPPASHLGVLLVDTTFDALGRLYIRYLRDEIVEPALNAFRDSGV
jgi:hypothetical protein